MTRSRNSNTKVYKVRQDAVNMAVGYLIASCKYVDSITIEEGTEVSMDGYKNDAVKEFELTNIEEALTIQIFASYLSNLPDPSERN